jgi:DNA-binding winged helix-turn-helix (wHTH) protein
MSTQVATAVETFVKSPASGEITPTAVSAALSRHLHLAKAPTNRLLFKNGSKPAAAAASDILFGPFRLLPTQFLLLDGDKAVRLGSRALQLLIVLVERRGELVSNQELMARVWPSVFVEPANLTVHISALRRALRDGCNGNRFIINVPGRGYVFVGSVKVSGHEDSST